MNSNQPPAPPCTAARRADLIYPGVGGFRSALSEYAVVVLVVAIITVVGWFIPTSHYPFGFVYLLAVVALSSRVGKGAVLFAAAVSAIAWNFVFMPPRLAFSAIHMESAIMLATYFLVALIAGQLTARLRAQERFERLREQRSKALLQLNRRLEAAPTEAEVVEAAVDQARKTFSAGAAIYLFDDNGRLQKANASAFTAPESVQRALQQLRRPLIPGRPMAETPPQLQWVPLQGDSELGLLALYCDTPPGRMGDRNEWLTGFAADLAAVIERRRARAAREREKLLTESDRLHRTLLDSVSHELKTPLAVLRAAVEKLPSSDAERRSHLVGEIQTATRRLQHLVGNLLNQTRLEAGAIKPNLDWCDVRDIVSVARRELAESLASHPVLLDIPEEMPLLMADAGLMEQVVGNLLLNAALHTPAGTPILLSAGLDAAGNRTWLRIADRGPGIPAGAKEALFEKFRRGKTARSGGVGLGLSIVRGFMLCQGGSVAVDDHDGGGSVFTVYLPHSLPSSVPFE